MNERFDKIAQVLEDSEANGSGLYRKRSAYGKRVAHLSVMEFGGDAEVKSAAKLFKVAPKMLEALCVFADFPEDVFEGEEDAPFTMTVRIRDLKIARDAIREATE